MQVLFVGVVVVVVSFLFGRLIVAKRTPSLEHLASGDSRSDIELVITGVAAGTGLLIAKLSGAFMFILIAGIMAWSMPFVLAYPKLFDSGE